METIKTLEGVHFDLLFAAFNSAFNDYEVQIGKEELGVMLQRRGFVPELSFGAFEGEKLVAFTLNGIGQFNGIKTAYDTGTGTLKEYRGKGLATAVFNHSIPFLRSAGVQQYLLEVLQHNGGAIAVYKNLGFEITREFNYFKGEQSSLQLLKPITLGCTISKLELTEVSRLAGEGDFNPSWQNSFEAINRRLSDFLIFGAFEGEMLVGYCIFEPTTGDITQIVTGREHRRNGVATALLREAIQYNRVATVKLINTEIGCESIAAFALKNGLSLKGKQFEMIKKI